MTGAQWGGARGQRARRRLRATLPAPCSKCGQPVYPDQRWHVDHIPPRDQLPNELWDDPQYQHPAHGKCNERAGAQYGNRKRKRKGKGKGTESISSAGAPHRPAPFLSLPKTIGNREMREWDIDIPIPPSLESPNNARAVGSYGDEFVAWCAASWPEQPLPWQEYTARRLLEHDDQGRLIHRRVGISVPRQVGKSVLLRQLAAFRLQCEERFGEPQTVLHVAHSLNTTEEVFYPAIETARRLGWLVREGNGQMKIQVGGNRWVPRSTQTGYGFTLSTALVDEAWAVAPRRVESGYAPTLSARASGQVVMFSTANEWATPLFPRFRETALQRDGWLLVEWSAPAGTDPHDQEAWQAACPVPISDERRALMGDELASDEYTFGFERLNRWPAAAGMDWGARVASVMQPATQTVWRGPLVGALESEFDGSWGVAVSDGSHVEAAEAPNRSAALTWLGARSPVRVLAHEAVIRQLPSDTRLVLVQVTATDAKAATAVLRDRAAGLSWSGVLAGQVRRCAVSTAGGQETIDARRSNGHVSAAKAGAWALWSAHTAPSQVPAIY